MQSISYAATNSNHHQSVLMGPRLISDGLVHSDQRQLERTETFTMSQLSCDGSRTTESKTMCMELLICQRCEREFDDKTAFEAHCIRCTDSE